MNSATFELEKRPCPTVDYLSIPKFSNELFPTTPNISIISNEN
jgi:hypothetical protein